MEVQKLANYDQMRKRWNADFKQVCISAGGSMLVSMLICAFLAKWLFGVMDQEVIVGTALEWISQLSVPMLFLLFLPVGAILIIPIVIMAVGQRPRPSDVEFNQALRRAFGMSDEVYTGKD